MIGRVSAPTRDLAAARGSEPGGEIDLDKLGETGQRTDDDYYVQLDKPEAGTRSRSVNWTLIHSTGHFASGGSPAYMQTIVMLAPQDMSDGSMNFFIRYARDRLVAATALFWGASRKKNQQSFSAWCVRVQISSSQESSREHGQCLEPPLCRPVEPDDGRQGQEKYVKIEQEVECPRDGNRPGTVSAA